MGGLVLLEHIRNPSYNNRCEVKSMRPKEYDITEGELKHLHLERHLTPLQIAKHYSCSSSTIYHYLKKWNIEKLPKYQRLEGKRFGRLLVKGFQGIDKNNQACWVCECRCGNEITATTAQIKFGQVKSCGCLQLEKATSHGMSGTRQYRIWVAMKSRCDNPKAWNYKRYGGRGISHVKAWSKFTNFWQDMKSGYSDDKTLERIDNGKGYGPHNCRWASAKEQNRNRRNSVRLTLNGVSRVASEWADKLGLPLSAIYERVNHGWPDKKVLTTPIRNSEVTT